MGKQGWRGSWTLSGSLSGGLISENPAVTSRRAWSATGSLAEPWVGVADQPRVMVVSTGWHVGLVIS